MFRHLNPFIRQLAYLRLCKNQRISCFSSQYEISLETKDTCPPLFVVIKLRLGEDKSSFVGKHSGGERGSFGQQTI